MYATVRATKFKSKSVLLMYVAKVQNLKSKDFLRELLIFVIRKLRISDCVVELSNQFNLSMVEMSGSHFKAKHQPIRFSIAYASIDLILF